MWNNPWSNHQYIIITTSGQSPVCGESNYLISGHFDICSNHHPSPHQTDNRENVRQQCVTSPLGGSQGSCSSFIVVVYMFIVRSPRSTWSGSPTTMNVPESSVLGNLTKCLMHHLALKILTPCFCDICLHVHSTITQISERSDQPGQVPQLPWMFQNQVCWGTWQNALWITWLSKF